MRKSLIAVFIVLFALTIPSLAASPDNENHRDIRHVLLISVDGMHALDLSNYVAAHPNSTLAQLSSHGITYTNASTPFVSDSFPGLSALITGGSPATTGFWYDVSYNRKLSPPAQSGASLCPGTVGTPVLYDESVDPDSSRLDAGGGIDPTAFPRDPANGCAPVFPHQYLRVNTIFNVAREAGLYTAWSDKHPSYEWVNGPSNQGTNDFFGPEVNSAVVPLTTAPFDVPRCHTIPDPAHTADWTKSTLNITCYDEIKVNAILNEIDGFTHDRSKPAPVPAIFGMNFQAVSVGQKLKGAGYVDVLGTPSAPLAGDLDFGRPVAGTDGERTQEEWIVRSDAHHYQRQTWTVAH
jgi:type I phosphodiesterase/nucleotide pyrophosphatase